MPFLLPVRAGFTTGKSSNRAVVPLRMTEARRQSRLLTTFKRQFICYAQHLLLYYIQYIRCGIILSVHLHSWEASENTSLFSLMVPLQYKADVLSDSLTGKALAWTQIWNYHRYLTYQQGSLPGILDQEASGQALHTAGLSARHGVHTHGADIGISERQNRTLWKHAEPHGTGR